MMRQLPEVRSSAFELDMATWGLEKSEKILRAAAKTLRVLRNPDLRDEVVREKAVSGALEVVEHAMHLLTFFTGIDFKPEEIQLVQEAGVEALENLERDRELITETRAEQRKREMAAYVEELAEDLAAFGRDLLPLLDGQASSRTTIHELIREHRLDDPRFKLVEDLTEALTMGYIGWDHYRSFVREYMMRHCGGSA